METLKLELDIVGLHMFFRMYKVPGKNECSLILGDKDLQRSSPVYGNVSKTLQIGRKQRGILIYCIKVQF